jgi:uncharacterized integral membrane protein (TIGR00698 family)
MTVSDPYRNRELFRFVGSMEGVPEWHDPAEGANRSGVRARGHALLERAGGLAPGLLLALGIAALASAARPWLSARGLGLENAPLSPILLAILAGLAIRNTVGLPPAYDPGVRLVVGRVLRVGVALLGIHLSLGTLAGSGLVALPVVASCILAAFLLAAWMTRTFGLPRRLGVLVAVGTAICGNTAIAATAPVIGADEDETSYAVGTITLFGLLALFVHPFVARALFDGDARLAGLFLGTAIHDTAQVAGAGLLYAQHYGAPVALDTATLTKLVRNLFMLAVIPMIALLHGGSEARRRSAGRPPLRQLLPFFVMGFAALALVRTLGDLAARDSIALLDAAWWTAAIGLASATSTGCLVVAMAGIGLATRLGRLRNLGLGPLAAGLATALTVGLVSTALVHLLARRLLEGS